jgi:hypothetical protein
MPTRLRNHMYDVYILSHLKAVGFLRSNNICAYHYVVTYLASQLRLKVTGFFVSKSLAIKYDRYINNHIICLREYVIFRVILSLV